MSNSSDRKKINIAVLIDPPAAMPCAIVDSSCKEPGITVDIAKLVCATLKYDCKFLWSGTSIYGQYDNGSWQGIVGLLSGENRSEFDTALPRLTPTFDRSSAVDFSSSYYYENHFLVARQTKLVEGAQTLDLSAAFRWQVWFGVVALFSFVVMHFLSDSSTENRTDSLIKILFRNRFPHLRFHCKYFLTGILLVTALILSGSYTGYLFSNRVAKLGKPPFTDFDTFVDCVEDGRCVVATKSASLGYMTQLIEAGTSRAFRRLKTAVLGRSAPHPIKDWPLDELLQRIKLEKDYYLTALIWDTDFYYASGPTQCDYYVIAPGIDAGMNSFPLPKNSSSRNDLDYLANIFTQHGLMNVIFKKYFRIDDNCSPNDNSQKATSDSMPFLMNVFILLGIGESVASAFFCLELYFRYACLKWTTGDSVRLLSDAVVSLYRVAISGRLISAKIN